jgi:hypothetical protein
VTEGLRFWRAIANFKVATHDIVGKTAEVAVAEFPRGLVA